MVKKAVKKVKKSRLLEEMVRANQEMGLYDGNQENPLIRNQNTDQSVGENNLPISGSTLPPEQARTPEQTVPTEVVKPEHTEVNEINFLLNKLTQILVTASTNNQYSDISFSYSDVALMYKLLNIAKDKTSKLDLVINNATIRDESLFKYVQELLLLINDQATLNTRTSEYLKEILRLTNLFIKKPV